jgi:hypothetical protein
VQRPTAVSKTLWPTDFGELTLRRPLSAPDHASGCPELRPGPQPLGPCWPATSGLVSAYMGLLAPWLLTPNLIPNLNPYPSPNQVYWLRWLPPKKSELLYHLAMTGSNVVAVACVGVWVVHAQAHLATRFFAAAAIAVLVFLRQKESNEHCRVSRWVSVMVRVKGPTSAAASVGGASSFSGAAPF